MENNSPQNETNSNEVRDYSFFSKEGVSTLFPKEAKRTFRTHHILKFIKEHPGTTSYKSSKVLGYSYSDVCRIVRDLEYCNIIFVKMDFSDSISRKRLYCPEEEVKND